MTTLPAGPLLHRCLPLAHFKPASNPPRNSPSSSSSSSLHHHRSLLAGSLLLSSSAPNRKLDSCATAAVRKLDAVPVQDAEADAAKRVEQSGDAVVRDAAEGAQSSAAEENSRFSTAAVPVVSEVGVNYQRLPINLDLQLYWARVLRQKGQQDQAVALLKQVLSSLPLRISWRREG